MNNLDEDEDILIEDLTEIEGSKPDIPNTRLEIDGVYSKEEAEYLSDMFKYEGEDSLPIYLVYGTSRLLLGNAKLEANSFLNIRRLSPKYRVRLVVDEAVKDIISPELTEEQMIENILDFLRIR